MQSLREYVLKLKSFLFDTDANTINKRTKFGAFLGATLFNYHLVNGNYVVLKNESPFILKLFLCASAMSVYAALGCVISINIPLSLLLVPSVVCIIKN